MAIFHISKRLTDYIQKHINPIGYARKIGVIVGKDCRLIDVSFSSEPYLVELGDHVSATRTRFETHDGGVWVCRGVDEEIDMVGKIKVGNNVFIGYGSLILPGVTIGNNVVIGAHSVVSKSIPDNSVAVGAPARVVGSFDAYCERSLANGERTKSLSVVEKRNFYLKKFQSDLRASHQSGEKH